jgi:hypothetical protein
VNDGLGSKRKEATVAYFKNTSAYPWEDQENPYSIKKSGFRADNRSQGVTNTKQEL